jgi:hypothetical protein
LALKEFLKQEQDRRAAAVAEAEKAAQAIKDARNAVKLGAAEKLALNKAVAAAAAWTPSATGDKAKDDAADAKAREAALRRANALRKRERKTMKTLDAEAKALKESKGEKSLEYTKAAAAFYKQKARVKLVTELIQATKKAAAAAAAEVEKAKFSTGLDARDQRDLKEALDKMKGTQDAAGRPDQAAANALLATFEDDLEVEMKDLGKKLEAKGAKATDA